MSLTTILLIVLILVLFFGANTWGNGQWALPGNIVGVLLVILLVVLILRAA